MTELLKENRFSVHYGYSNVPLSVSDIRLSPGVPWSGPGSVQLKGRFCQEMWDFLRAADDNPLIIRLYDSRSGDPHSAVITMVMTDIDPQRTKVETIALDAMGNDYLLLSATINFMSLRVVSGGSILDFVADASK